VSARSITRTYAGNGALSSRTRSTTTSSVSGVPRGISWTRTNAILDERHAIAQLGDGVVPPRGVHHDALELHVSCRVHRLHGCARRARRAAPIRRFARSVDRRPVRDACEHEAHHASEKRVPGRDRGDVDQVPERAPHALAVATPGPLRHLTEVDHHREASELGAEALCPREQHLTAVSGLVRDLAHEDDSGLDQRTRASSSPAVIAPPAVSISSLGSFHGRAGTTARA
jgi:hypothetical protein